MPDIKCKSMSMQERKETISRLVEQFREGEKFYMSKDFVESECRSKFIDPLLECLGWDVKNEKGARHDKQEVITEDRVVINGQVKHPDYTLCYGGERKIYIEAKQPSIDLKNDPSPALQVRRYAYTSKMPIAILTDFQELAIYDTRIKPKKTDNSSAARIEYITYQQFHDKFEELYKKISWEAVDLGHFDTFYESAKDKKGTATVDDDILAMIEQWRAYLAEDIALHNEEIDEYNLTSAVQKIIDRILFLRICEDKEIEEYNSLKKIAESKIDIYLQLKKLFSAANDKFNAGLFASDKWLDSLTISDKTLCLIINALYYPECQYEFSVLPVEILGSIYEQFLGKIIRFSRKTKNGHSVEIIEKPEVQKAGGVYYTPPYIVKYIVRQTIGKKIEGKTPDEVSKMRFLDPACGSGSFLVGAYKYLLDWHLDYYLGSVSSGLKPAADRTENLYEKRGIIYKDSVTHDYKLSVEEKRRILLNNIYGVDIDAQAVEVTKLSLFLKLLENEGKALSQGQTLLFRQSDLSEKILPSMSGNIKCGNSLIGSDYYDDKDLLLFDMAKQRKVNAFDWEKEFARSAAACGGSTPCGDSSALFDCVIGNPPYVLCQPGSTEESLLAYYKRYAVASYKIDLFHLFFEKSINLLKQDGLMGYITPNTYLTNMYMKVLRQFILQNCDINNVVIHDKVFDTASVDVATIILSKFKEKDHLISIEKTVKSIFSNIGTKAQSEWENDEECMFNVNTDTYVKIDKANCTTLGEIASVTFGLQTKDKNTFVKESPLSEEWEPCYTGKDIQRYYLSNAKLYFLNNPQKVKAGGSWNMDIHHSKKIVIRQIGAPEPVVAYDDYGYATLNTMYSVVLLNTSYSIFYVLAILNSKLLKEYWLATYSDNKELFPKIKGYQLKELPIPTATPAEQEPLIKLANAMMKTKTQLANAMSDSDKRMIEQKIDLIDRQINNTVYKLYGLNDDEIRVVEGK